MDEPNVELKCQSVRSLSGVWPLTASMEVKNKYAYVITQDICNKFIEVKFLMGCMVLWPNCLLQDLTTMSLINKITLGGTKDEHFSCIHSSCQCGLSIIDHCEKVIFEPPFEECHI